MGGGLEMELGRDLSKSLALSDPTKASLLHLLMSCAMHEDDCNDMQRVSVRA